MSLRIEIGDVRSVLLPDGWHGVRSRTFGLDSYEFAHGEDLIHGSGESGVCPVGFCFEEESSGDWIFGPLSAILAVRRTEPDRYESGETS
jgi:hypothetical protein